MSSLRITQVGLQSSDKCPYTQTEAEAEGKLPGPGRPGATGCRRGREGVGRGAGGAGRYSVLRYLEARGPAAILAPDLGPPGLLLLHHSVCGVLSAHTLNAQRSLPTPL